MWPTSVLRYVIQTLQTLVHKPASLVTLFDPANAIGERHETDSRTKASHSERLKKKGNSVGRFSADVLRRVVARGVQEGLIGPNPSNSPVRNVSEFTAGGGGGAGIQVKCDGILRLSLGGGGGLGISQQLFKEKNSDDSTPTVGRASQAGSPSVVTSGAGFGAGVQVFNRRGNKIMSLGGGGGASQALEYFLPSCASGCTSTVPQVTRTSGSSPDKDSFVAWGGVHWGGATGAEGNSTTTAEDVRNALKGLVSEVGTNGVTPS
jgi:hypothetical protein